MPDEHDEPPPYEDQPYQGGFGAPEGLAISAFTSSSAPGAFVSDCYSTAQLTKMQRIVNEYRKTLVAYQELIIAVKGSVAGLQSIKIDSKETFDILCKTLMGLQDAIARGNGLSPIDL